MFSITSNQAWSKVVDAGTYWYRVTAEGVPKLDKEFPKCSSTVKFDGHYPNKV